MTEEGYTYEGDLKRFKKERLKDKLKKQREDARKFEPRRYTRRDENFASRFNAGTRMLGDSN